MKNKIKGNIYKEEIINPKMKRGVLILVSFILLSSLISVVSAYTCYDADVNKDGKANSVDLSYISAKINQTCSEANRWCDWADMNKDRQVSQDDLTLNYNVRTENKCASWVAACTDSDAGISKYVKGKAVISGVESKEDQCLGVNLLEYYCENDAIKLMEIPCGCYEGVCYETATCTDTEQPGKSNWYQDKFLKGTTTVKYKNNNGGESGIEYVDECNDEGKLVDYTCSPSEDSNFVAVGFGNYIDCEYGCSNGACLKETSQTCSNIKCDDGTIAKCALNMGTGYCSCESCPSIDLDIDSCLDNPKRYWDQETDKCYDYNPNWIPSYCSDPDGGKNIFEYAHTYGFRSYSSADDPSRDLRIRTGGSDGCYNWQLIEHYCDAQGYIQTEYITCPNGCDTNSKGACIKGEAITEKITCKFEGTSKQQQCYLAGQFTPADEGTKFCYAEAGPGSCVINYKDYKGAEVTWKSTCGSLAYTKQDGNDEVIYFKCSEGETNISEILNKGFRNVYFECYDGESSKSTERDACKSADYWKKFASNFCASHCEKSVEKCEQKYGVEEKNEDVIKCIGKCGINSFSLGNECYLQEETTTSPVQECKTDSDCSQPSCELGVPAEECPKTNKCVNGRCEPIVEMVSEGIMLICKDSCPLDGKCYPFGYRKSGKYCSDMGGFVEQKKNEACDNNFECSSNVCVNNNCISQGFIEKIISWFKRLFGGG
ncbi:MAG: hypothetical protein KKB21_03525 [Nanoarchaeota archaeon]|nr:hypothetical protein [Nanoarchaeota archaeon]MBU4086618.1 hypothetical protein [Nanoarchaeota archaeon]